MGNKSLKKKKKNKNKNSKAFEKLKPPIFALIISFSIFITVSALGLIFDIPSEYDYIISLLCFTLICFITGFIAGIKKRHKGLIVGIVYCLPTIFTVIIVSLILNSFSVGINLIITVLSLLSASALGGVVAVNKRLK